MDLRSLIHCSRQSLREIGHENELREVLERVFQEDISYLYAHDEELVSKDKVSEIERIIKNRKQGLPLAYLLKERNFYGRDFYVNPSVLIPRLETEFSILELMNLPGESFLEVGLGSGCVSITMKMERPQLEVSGIDISQEALEVAKKNAKKYGVRVNFFQSNLFDKVHDSYDIIYSNPPYIESKTLESLEIEVKNYEPRLALDGGEDGLNFYREIIKKTPLFLNKDGFLVFEIGYNQKEAIFHLLEDIHFQGRCLKDYGGYDRVIVASRRK